MNKFGETLRDLRVAQERGLRETAVAIGISPTYLSRIERGKERPPRPEVIKDLAKYLAADPDVLFRLSASTDPDIVNYLHARPEMMQMLRSLMDSDVPPATIEKITVVVEEMLCQAR